MGLTRKPNFLCISTLFVIMGLSCSGCSKKNEQAAKVIQQEKEGEGRFLPDKDLSKQFAKMHHKYLGLFLQALSGIREGKLDFLSGVVDASLFEPSQTQTRRVDLEAWSPSGPVSFESGKGSVLEKSKGYVHQILFPIDWSVDPLKSRTWRFRFQSLMWLEEYLDRYEKNGDAEVLMVACKIARDWILVHTTWPSDKRSFIFGDHSMAERVEVLTRLLRTYRSSDFHDEKFSRLLVASIWSQLALMMTAERYLAWHNHAIIFDRSLLKVLTDLRELKPREEMVRFSGRRAMEQLRFSFSTDGVHREHSPCYHGFVIRLFVQIVDLLGKNGVAIPKDVSERMDKTVAFATHVMKPDGTLPGIGDCTDGKPFLLNSKTKAWLQKRSSEFQYALSAGREGSSPKETVTIFPIGGWAMFRGSWDKGAEENVFVAIQSDFNSFGHYQEDDTSFVMEVDGNRLVIDPGLNDYNKTPMSRYMRKARAHNVLLADGKDFDFDLKNTGTSGITRTVAHQAADGFTQHAVELTHTHYQRLSIRVSRQFGRLAKTAFVLRDVVRAEKEHRYQQIFHLAPGAKVTQTGEDLLLVQWKNHPYSLLLRSNFTSHKLIEGQKDPVQGWWFPSFGTPEPQPVLVLERSGSSLGFQTLLVVSKASAKTDWKNLAAQSAKLISELEAQPSRTLKRKPVPKKWVF